MSSFEKSNQLGISIPSGICELVWKVSRLGLSNPSDIVEEENFSLLVLDDAYLDPNGVIPYGLYVCPNRPKGL